MFNLEVLNEIKCSILNSSMKNEKAKNFVTKQTDPYVVEGEKFTWWWDECTWCVPGINVPGDGIKASAPKSSPSCSYCMWVDVVKTKNLSISNIITSDKSIKNAKSGKVLHSITIITEHYCTRVHVVKTKNLPWQRSLSIFDTLANFAKKIIEIFRV